MAATEPESCGVTPGAAREVERAKFEESLDRLLERRLEADGPGTAQELAVAMGLEPDLVEETLRDLESEGVVTSGHFLVDKEFQYMMTDLHLR